MTNFRTLLSLEAILLFRFLKGRSSNYVLQPLKHPVISSIVALLPKKYFGNCIIGENFWWAHCLKISQKVRHFWSFSNIVNAKNSWPWNIDDARRFSKGVFGSMENWQKLVGWLVNLWGDGRGQKFAKMRQSINCDVLQILSNNKCGTAALESSIQDLLFFHFSASKKKLTLRLYITNQVSAEDSSRDSYHVNRKTKEKSRILFSKEIRLSGGHFFFVKTVPFLWVWKWMNFEPWSNRI